MSDLWYFVIIYQLKKTLEKKEFFKMTEMQSTVKWKCHQPTMINTFYALLQNDTFTDCTLAAEGKFVKAHRMVLSACSSYFADLLTQQYAKHPIFMLKDIKFDELCSLITYMYKGEVDIRDNQIHDILKTADALQIKGLSKKKPCKSK